MATVHSILLHYAETQPPKPVDSSAITATGGIEGDSHADEPRRNRRVLVTDLETLDANGLKPGDLREQITVSGLEVNSLNPGTILQIGSAKAEVIGPCAPCLTIGAYLGAQDVEAFRDQMQDKRGMFVLFDGSSEGVEISVGDEVSIQAKP